MSWQAFAFQVLNAAKLMNDMKHICHTLSGVVYVTLKVYKSRSLLKDSVFVALSYSVINSF